MNLLKESLALIPNNVSKELLLAPYDTNELGGIILN